MDAIQEFSVLTEQLFGRVWEKLWRRGQWHSCSGTNAFHGSAYEFIRNSAMDARNFFDGPTIPPFKRNQFGVSAGAPIQKDKTFIFGDYEGIRQGTGITNVDTVPSLNARKGIISDGTPIVSSCPAGSAKLDPNANYCVDNNAAKYLGLYPLPTEAPDPSTPDIATFRFAGQQVINENFFTIRVDHKLSDRGQIFLGPTSLTKPPTHHPIFSTTYNWNP